MRNITDLFETIGFIVSYFLSKDITLLNAFLCWNKDSILEVHKACSQHNLMLHVTTDFGDTTRLLENNIYQRQGVVVDANCVGADILLKFMSDTRTFNIINNILVLDDKFNEPNLTDIAQKVEALEILPDSDFVWSTSNTYLVDVYKVKTSEPPIFSKHSIDFDSDSNIVKKEKSIRNIWTKLGSVGSRRKDLRRIYIRAATIISQPHYFTGWNDLSMRHIDTWPKLTYPIILNMADDLNMRLDMFQVDNYGVERNGTFDGLVGRLQRKEIELGITSMFLRKDRWAVVDFCAETVYLKAFFIFKQPPQSTVSNIFLLPFSQYVWLALFAAFTALGLLMCVHVKLMRKADRNLEIATKSEVFSVMVGAICQQGSYIMPSLSSSRILSFFAFLTSLFLFTAYSAKIVALLQTPSTAIKTISDLGHSPMTLGIQETTYKSVYFKESNDVSTQELYTHKIAPQGSKAYHSVVDGIKRVRGGLFAFQVEESSGYKIISDTFTEQEKCGLTEIEAFSLPMTAVPVKKQSGYRELFAIRIRWQREIGILSRLRKIWLAQKPVCNEGTTGFVSVGVTECFPAFQVLLYGLALSILILVLELIIARYSQEK